MSKTCPINLCNITVINKSIECPYCKFQACTDCYKQSFIINLKEGIRNIKCLDIRCNKVFNDDFIYKNLPRNFLKKDIKKYEENILLEKEKAMFGETIELISRNKKIKNLEEQKKIYLEKITMLEVDIYKLKYNKTDKEKKKKVNIVRKCPDNKCNGYLDSENTCGICDLILCSKCENIKKEEHKCNNDDIKTVELKYKTSKPCPNCSIMTFKVDGCSQVFCAPPCNEGKGTAWNFNTGEIDNGPIHSPDYYEYMRKNNGGIVPRQDCRMENEIPELWDLKGKIPIGDFNIITDIHRFFVNVRYNTMVKYNIMDNNDFDKNLDLRMKFLCKSEDITEDKMKKTLYTRNKKMNKYKAIHQNLDMLYNVGVDIFNQLKFQPKINKKTKLICLEDTYLALENIRKYYNDMIIRTKDRYDCKSLDVSVITPEWNFSH